MHLALQIATLTACLFAPPAAADCVTADTLAKGIAFTRANGVGGLALREGAEVRIEYKYTAASGNQDERVGRFGIYETESVYEYNDPTPGVIDGWSRSNTVTRLSRRGMEPVPGATFTTAWKAKSSYCSGASCPEVYRTKGSVTYRFLPLQTGTISGCAYSVIPVEATFSGDQMHSTIRWLYFPELRFGLETRVTDHRSGKDEKLGLTAMKPAG
jgi:hypothetical protein